MQFQNLPEFNLKQYIYCQKQNHFNSPFIYLKFSENKEQILQCIYCVPEDFQDQDQDRKIVLDQLLKSPFYLINNLPYLRENEREIKQILKNFDINQFNDFKNRLQNQVNEIYEELENKLIKQLNLSKKSVLLQFEEIMNTIQISDIYDFQKLKQNFQQLQLGQTDLDQLFKIQLDVKNKLQNKQNSEIILNNQKIREQIEKSINNLEKKLDEKLDQFKENIYLESQALNEIKLKYLKFFKSNYNQELNIQQDIQIQHINNQTKFYFHDKIIQKNKQIYSEPLDKTKTYQFKLKIDLKGQNKQQILFVLLGSQDKDNCWQKQNIITLTNRSGATFASNGKKEIKNGLRFSKFMKDDQTIFYLVFNYKQKIFELFDEQKKGYIKTEIDENLVKGDLLFGLHFHQMYQNTGIFTLLNAEFI